MNIADEFGSQLKIFSNKMDMSNLTIAVSLPTIPDLYSSLK